MEQRYFVLLLAGFLISAALVSVGYAAATSTTSTSENTIENGDSLIVMLTDPRSYTGDEVPVKVRMPDADTHVTYTEDGHSIAYSVTEGGRAQVSYMGDPVAEGIGIRLSSVSSVEGDLTLTVSSDSLFPAVYVDREVSFKARITGDCLEEPLTAEFGSDGKAAVLLEGLSGLLEDGIDLLFDLVVEFGDEAEEQQEVGSGRIMGFILGFELTKEIA